MKEIPLTIRRFGAFLALALCVLLLTSHAVESALVDPQRYIVGPGDEFTIEFFETQTTAIKAEVSPEGILAIPNVGAFPVGGETLEKTKDLLRQGLKRRFSGVDATISLSQVRKQRILVSGAVVNPGLYESSATNLVSDVIARAGGLKPEASRRNIMIRGSKSETPVDMDMFTRAGSLDANPPLYLGDVVHVPVMSDSASRIYVSGAVRSPGWVEYTGRDRISDLLALAGGLTQTARQDSVALSDGTTVSRQTTGFSGLIEEGARLIAIPITDSEVGDGVYIGGEVRVPGSYPYTLGMTSGDLIAAAGGLLSESSYIEGFVVFNNLLTEKNALDVFQKASDRSAHNVRLSELYDLQGLRHNSQEEMECFADPLSPFPCLSLIPGDSIVIPKRTGAVTVLGQVKRPGLISNSLSYGTTINPELLDQRLLAKEVSLGNCISAAGGKTAWSDMKRSYVRRRLTGVAVPLSSNPRIYDGDVIYIAKKPNKERRGTLSTLRDITLIAAGAALTVYSIDQMGN